MMRQRRTLLVVLATVLAFVAAACGSSADEVDVMAEAPVADSTSDPVADESDVADEAADTEADDAAEPEPEPVVLPSGREALAAAEGQAYALWFWGAH